ncbi:Phosphate abc transporter, inner membrane subunit psta [Rhodospirillaceae bacterium LM-1]|nr:Phosphate abc transporter, inner membrane subunit psta [Rhodospirillaceae bacterium LM-1]
MNPGDMLEAVAVKPVTRVSQTRRSYESSLTARGEPFLWGFGGALAFGVLLVVGFLVLVTWNGITTFWPKPIHVVTLNSGDLVAGEPTRSEPFKVGPERLTSLSEAAKAKIAKDDGFAHRVLLRTGNFDLYNDDFRWVEDYKIEKTEMPVGMFFIERQEWGAFVGGIKALNRNGATITGDELTLDLLHKEHEAARRRFEAIHDIERGAIGDVNYELNQERLKIRKAVLKYGDNAPEVKAVEAEVEKHASVLKGRFDVLAAKAQEIKDEDAKVQAVLADINGTEKVMPLSLIVRFYPANELSALGKVGIYLSRWAEFLTDDPREANTEGGVLPAIFGTFVMTLLMVVVVAPFGVLTALYLREYAKQGRLVSIVRISVNNLAGVPSIVYGVFGLGFFAYIVGGGIDALFYPERLPNPTFGTGGLLWSSLTLALLTVPVVIVATEEALAAVPKSMREGSLACGASKWQTIKNIVLPRAMPGIMTGLILAMARGAGEVAPLMLVGVVKLAPELPIDGFWPFIHLERSFMHLGFHIFDVGFQSRNSEAGKPMVFVTTLLLIALIAVMNASAVVIRNRLKRKFMVGHF